MTIKSPRYNGGLCLLTLRRVSDSSIVWTNPKPGGADYLRPYLMSFEPFPDS